MSLPPTPEKSLCIPYKLRVGFILTVNLYVAPANPGEIVVYTVYRINCARLHFDRKIICRSRQPRQFLVFFKENACRPNPTRFLVFSSKTRLGFNVIVNLHVMRPTAPDLRIFFQGKHASQQPFQIPCVFSSKTRLGFNVIVHLHVMRSIAPTFLVFFRRKCASQESCRIPWVHFPCVFSGNPRLAFRSDCELHMMRPTAP